MIHLFDPENKFWRFVAKLADVACMSFLWALTSLPLFTVGASTAAFYDFSMRQVRDTEGRVWKSYFRAFRRHFKKATLLWLVELAGLAFFAADLLAAWNFFLLHPGAAGVAVLGLCLCGALIFLGCVFYFYPTLAVFDFPVKKLLRDSFLLAMANLPVTVTLLAMAALACLGFYYLSGLFFFWVGLYVFFSSYLLTGVYWKYAGGGEDDDSEGEAP